MCSSQYNVGYLPNEAIRVTSPSVFFADALRQRAVRLRNDGETLTRRAHQHRCTFTPQSPGTYKVICTVPGHEQAGMVAALVVKRLGRRASILRDPGPNGRGLST